MDTIYLDPPTWDLAVDVDGNIAKASNPYALAQDAASAIKLFEGELYYDTKPGVPYWTQILGKNPPVALMKAHFEFAAKTVPEVVAARAFIAGFGNDRKVTGQVQVTDSTGTVLAAAGF